MKSILYLLLFFTVSCHNSSHSNFKDVRSTSQNIYQKSIQPIFNNKCIACHSCYNAPCQLKLTSYEGLQRGGHHSSIYDFPALVAKEPTRLFVDAHTEKDWRKKGFFTVHSSQKYSLLSHLIDNKGPFRKLRYKKSEESRQCSSSVSDYPMNNYNSYMPYALPKLSLDEIQTIKTWEESGKKGPLSVNFEREILGDKKFSTKVEKWEKLFNRNDMKARLSSRYIYEHLFLANIYFLNDKKQFFRLVRSATRVGDIKEIGTTYPFDRPQGDFYYRLRPVAQTIVHKSHIPFPFSHKKYNQWLTDFYKSEWKSVPKTMPGYGKEGANPFKTFHSIPGIARYRFFLQESAYHIMTFIKGPVCRGPTALNVINDHFWVTFMDPSYDAIVNDHKLEEKMAKLMKLPAEIKDDFKPFKDFRKSYWKANKLKMKSLINKKKSVTKNWLWNGDKSNSNSLITVYRHYDSAQVLRGLKGTTPKTVWTLDYHVFETIYYNLTAGYNVFGPLLHQVNSRLFMELSRISSEDLFLSFIDLKSRKGLREEWNKKIPKGRKTLAVSVVDSFIQNAKDEMTYEYPYNGNLLQTSLKARSVLSFKKNTIDSHFSSDQINNEQEKIENLFHLKGHKSENFRFLPNTIMIKLENGNSQDFYTMILNQSHYNISMMFLEESRRDFKNDHFNIVKGIASSYANLFVKLKKINVSTFITDLKNISNKEEADKWIEKYGILRDQKNFWQDYADFSKNSYNKKTNELGWLDLNRYLLHMKGDFVVEKTF